MNILKKAESTMAFFKAGLFGFQGSGKTFTAALLAIGICNATKQKNVAFFDTETGSDFLLPKLKDAGLEVYQVKSRAFGDLLETLKECEKEGIAVLIIDSITHVWRDLCDSYDKKLNRRGRLQFQDWAVLKGEWRNYTDLFVNSKVHVIVCGRAGYEYDYDFNEDGSKDLIKTGTKMKTESEFGFEPSLVIEMERVSKARDEIDQIDTSKRDGRQKKQAYSPKIGSGWIHRAHVLKDRTDTMNGKVFDYPTFKDFEPHFKALNIGGEHLGLDTSRDSSDRFDNQGRPDWQRIKERKEIALEEIAERMKIIWPTTGAEDKKSRQKFLEHVFGTLSWKAVESKTEVERLESVAKNLKQFENNFAKNPDVPMDVLWDEIESAEVMAKEAASTGDDIPI